MVFVIFTPPFTPFFCAHHCKLTYSCMLVGQIKGHLWFWENVMGIFHYTTTFVSDSPDSSRFEGFRQLFLSLCATYSSNIHQCQFS